ncbi:hypothetical protein [Mixta calida]|uniref:hypothetical protein n=1 Tax=Mixta calida TaxID=665913 RepID=UPI00289D5571|nr:hypothetical protein [Mixta calida]
MKSVLLFITIIPFVCLIFSFSFWLLNRSKYYKLIAEFKKSYILPMPYSLHCNMGFLGSPLLSYFFLRLNAKKRIFFLEKESAVYGFTDKNKNKELVKVLVPIYYAFLIGFSCCCFLGLIAVFIKLESYFLI